MAQKAHTLIEAPEDRNLKVISILGGAGSVSRLHNLGIFEGVILKKKKGAFRGPVVVEVKGATVALGRGMAFKIEVTGE